MYVPTLFLRNLLEEANAITTSKIYFYRVNAFHRSKDWTEWEQLREIVRLMVCCYCRTKFCKPSKYLENKYLQTNLGEEPFHQRIVLTESKWNERVLILAIIFINFVMGLQDPLFSGNYVILTSRWILLCSSVFVDFQIWNFNILEIKLHIKVT